MDSVEFQQNKDDQSKDRIDASKVESLQKTASSPSIKASSNFSPLINRNGNNFKRKENAEESFDESDEDPDEEENDPEPEAFVDNENEDSRDDEDFIMLKEKFKKKVRAN